MFFFLPLNNIFDYIIFHFTPIDFLPKHFILFEKPPIPPHHITATMHL